MKGADGAPLQRVRVEIRPQGAGTAKAAFTDAAGRFALTGLKPGTYDLRMTRLGFQPHEASGLELVADRPTELTFTLEIAESPGRGRIQRPAERGGEPLPPPQAAQETQTAYPPLRLRAGRPLTPPDAPAGPLPTTEPEFRPLGNAGKPRGKSAIPSRPDFVPVPDRWRIGLPRWDRYQDLASGLAPYATGRRADPYNQNVLKGDYPIFGDSWFLNLQGRSETISEYRRLPVVGPPSAERPAEPDFFSKGDQFQFIEVLEFSVDLFQGYTAFKPFDLRFRVTPALSLNYLKVRERGLVNIDVREGTTRPDSHASLEEAFAEVKLADTSPFYDFVSLRVGTQFFNSDFRGFIFFDNQPGIRLFGNFKANKHQYNLAYFYMLEKDTNSLLNTFDWRRQHVAVANYYIQDFIKLGYTAQFSVHFNNDRPSLHFNTNDFVVRPAPVSNVTPKSVNAVYFGWAGDGHFGTLNINHAFYQVIGQEKPNQIAGDFLG
ncbi:MAG: carboxypeptidase regulatory-like domain-containing protein, partial [Acidobacteriota bacterium]